MIISQRFIGGSLPLRNLVLTASRSAQGATAAQIEQTIWKEFCATVCLRRPKAGGGAYSLTDVRVKVRATLRKLRRGEIIRAARSRVKRPSRQAPPITAAGLTAYRLLIDNLEPLRLTRAEAEVARFMLGRLDNAQCTDTVSYIARGTGLAGITVKKARQALVQRGLFCRARPNSRKGSAPYWPDAEKVAQTLEIFGGM